MKKYYNNIEKISKNIKKYYNNIKKISKNMTKNIIII